MTKDKEERGLILRFFWNCAETKLLLTSLFFLCSLVTLLQLFPSRSFLTLHCLNPLPTPPLPATTLPDFSIQSGAIRRSFTPIGSAAPLFIQMGAYRGSATSFSIVGLASKPLHIYGKPVFRCEWKPSASSLSIPTSHSYKLLPDWGFGRIYTVVVINCTFPSPIDASGGQLLLFASPSPSAPETLIVALDESPGQFNLSTLSAAPKYDYLYCGSSLFGNISPQRIREWIAYHAQLFGTRGHIVFHDAGGVHEGVMEVLRPWMEKGVVTLQNITQQEEFDGYYHNQFLVVNDCLHRYRLSAKWIFFFDVDEFIYLQPTTKFDSFMKSMEEYSQFTIEQNPMSNKLCLSADAGKTSRMWGFEKLVYRDIKRGIRRNRKYAVQPRSAFSAGVHMSQNVDGKTLHGSGRRIAYFHYHDTIAERRDPCREFVNATLLAFDGIPFSLDDTLRRGARRVKQFELDAVGPRLSRTRQ